MKAFQCISVNGLGIREYFSVFQLTVGYYGTFQCRDHAFRHARCMIRGTLAHETRQGVRHSRCRS